MQAHWQHTESTFLIWKGHFTWLGPFLNRKWANLQCSKGSFGSRNSSNMQLLFQQKNGGGEWGGAIYSECWGTKTMLGLKTSLHGSALLGNNSVEHLHPDLSYLESLYHRHHPRRQCPWKGTVPITDGVWGSLGKARTVPLPANPQITAAAQWLVFAVGRRVMPQTLLTAASWSPDENIHFTPQTYFFSPLWCFLLSSFNIINKGDDIISLAKTPINAQTVFNTGTQRDFFTI